MSLESKAADEIRTTIFLVLRVMKTNNLVVTSNKLTVNFAALVKSGHGPLVVREKLVDNAC